MEHTKSWHVTFDLLLWPWYITCSSGASNIFTQHVFSVRWKYVWNIFSSLDMEHTKSWQVTFDLLLWPWYITCSSGASNIFTQHVFSVRWKYVWNIFSSLDMEHTKSWQVTFDLLLWPWYITCSSGASNIFSQHVFSVRWKYVWNIFSIGTRFMRYGATTNYSVSWNMEQPQILYMWPLTSCYHSITLTLKLGVWNFALNDVSLCEIFLESNQEIWRGYKFYTCDLKVDMWVKYFQNSTRD